MEGQRVQVISREIVKPSSQISHRLKKMKLSYLDQLIPPVYIPIIFFYQADESRGLTASNQAQISQQMKQSMSNALTSFYPLAGRAEADCLAVDCNDAGVEFIEARVRAHLLDGVKDPSMEELKQYIPMDPTGVAGPGERPLFMVQITFFDCGGIALGVCFSHLIADCKSVMAFVNAWAAACREKPETSHQLVSFDLADYFPAREFPALDLWTSRMSDEKTTTKRFMFTKEILAHLKQDAVSPSGSGVKDPTRVELISAFIWKQLLEVAKLKNPNSTKTYAALHAVNLRGRKSPSHLLENVFGNCLMLSVACADTTKFYHQQVSELRSAIWRIDDNYITESQNGISYMSDLYKVLPLILEGELEWCTFSSWCRFPVYEVEYGFGRPIWCCTTAVPVKNAVILVSSKSGESIEAWVSMDEDNLQMLEAQLNLISGGDTVNLNLLLKS